MTRSAVTMQSAGEWVEARGLRHSCQDEGLSERQGTGGVAGTAHPLGESFQGGSPGVPLEESLEAPVQGSSCS